MRAVRFNNRLSKRDRRSTRIQKDTRPLPQGSGLTRHLHPRPLRGTERRGSPPIKEPITPSCKNPSSLSSISRSALCSSNSAGRHRHVSWMSGAREQATPGQSASIQPARAVRFRSGTWLYYTGLEVSGLRRSFSSHNLRARRSVSSSPLDQANGCAALTICIARSRGSPIIIK